MAIEINNGLGPLSQRGGKTTESGIANAAGNDKTPSAQHQAELKDSVQISADANSVRNLANKLEQQESFDEVRVAEIRQAISEGNYPIDNQRLAENFLALESQL